MDLVRQRVTAPIRWPPIRTARFDSDPMPQLTFLPLRDIGGTVAPEHAHAAVCGLLDRGPVSWGHDDVDKPYTISPITRIRRQVGVQMATAHRASDALHEAAPHAGLLRLGSVGSHVGHLHSLDAASWDQLAGRSLAAAHRSISAPNAATLSLRLRRRRGGPAGGAAVRACSVRRRGAFRSKGMDVVYVRRNRSGPEVLGATDARRPVRPVQ